MRLVQLEPDGAQLFPSLLDGATVDRLRRLANGPGQRLHGQLSVNAVAVSPGVAGQLAMNLLGATARPVRAVMFDKTPEANWSVAWHQDRTIAITERQEVAGFGPWSLKQGIVHVEPPAEVMADMLTLRLHLDPCDLDYAPLIAACGSHRLGRIAAPQVAEVAAGQERLVCLADTGDIWAYRTLILHASERSRSPSRRRVLQIDYATRDLPGGLAWLGLG